MEHKEFSEMNVIPLVDVMLVLLTIVLTTATFIVAGEISVNLPDAKNRENRSTHPIFITITEDERLFIEKSEVSLEELASHIKSFDNEQAVVIRADKNVPINKFVVVIDALKEDGFKNVSLEVKEK